MFLREKDGKYAGEIREFRPDVGAELLAAGRAENPYAESAAAAPAAAPAPVKGKGKASRK